MSGDKAQGKWVLVFLNDVSAKYIYTGLVKTLTCFADSLFCVLITVRTPYVYVLTFKTMGGSSSTFGNLTFLVKAVQRLTSQ